MPSMDNVIEKYKNKPDLSREDVADILKSIGKPGEKQDEKIATITQLGKANFQGHNIALALTSYPEF